MESGVISLHTHLIPSYLWSLTSDYNKWSCQAKTSDILFEMLPKQHYNMFSDYSHIYVTGVWILLIYTFYI